MSKKVLFICQGNVGRSQMAEGYYNHLNSSQNASSAGISDVGLKYNYKPTDLIVKVMKEDGVDVSHQRVKQLTSGMVDSSDLVIVLCNKEICPDFVKTSSKVRYQQVTDPYQAKKETTIAIRDEIKSIVKQLLSS